MARKLKMDFSLHAIVHQVHVVTIFLYYSIVKVIMIADSPCLNEVAMKGS